jgi:hypothetical protein
MGWTMLYLFLFLKLPIVALCWIVWWAIHQDTEETGDRSDGGAGRRVHPYHPRPPRPRPPRRGPHGDPVPSAPPRIRSVTAAGRERSLEH